MWKYYYCDFFLYTWLTIAIPQNVWLDTYWWKAILQRYVKFILTIFIYFGSEIFTLFKIYLHWLASINFLLVLWKRKQHLSTYWVIYWWLYYQLLLKQKYEIDCVCAFLTGDFSVTFLSPKASTRSSSKLCIFVYLHSQRVHLEWLCKLKEWKTFTNTPIIMNLLHY